MANAPRKDFPRKYEVLPLFATYKAAGPDDLPLPPSNEAPLSPTSQYTCARCGEVKIYDMSRTCANSLGYQTGLSDARDLALIILPVEKEEVSLTSYDPCPFCTIDPGKLRAPAFWASVRVVCEDLRKKTLAIRGTRNYRNPGLLAPTMRPKVRPQANQTIAYICAHGREGLLVQGQILPWYDRFHASKWLNRCRTYHGPACNKRAPGIEGMRLIDCSTGAVVKADPSWRWLALSYVWGVEEGPVERPEQFPKTVRDAVRVTREIGYRYLWVDALCIDQADGPHKAEQIRNMDKIYRGADMTLVAASSHSKHTGLSGVGIPRSRLYDTFRFGDRVILQAHPDRESDRNPVEHVHESSPWWQRAWTFQEGLLSKRMLVFTNREMSFYCQEAAWTETQRNVLGGERDQITPWENSLLLNRSLFGQTELSSSSSDRTVDREAEQLHVLNEYFNLAGQYADREMTDERDALNAFLGVTNHLETLSRTVSLSTMSGLPFVAFNGSRAIPGVWAFVALSWYHVGDAPQRRVFFPSWTWAGWSGKVYWMLRDVFRGHADVKMISYTHDVLFCSDYAEFELPSDEDTQERLDSVRSIRFHAPIIPCAHFSTHKGFSGELWSHVLLWDKRMVNRNVLEHLDTPQHFYTQLESGAWTCFWLGSIWSQQHSYDHYGFVLVVEWKSEYTAERIGGFAVPTQFVNVRAETLQYRTVQLL